MKQTVDIADSILPLLSSLTSAFFIALKIEKFRKESLNKYFLLLGSKVIVNPTQRSFTGAAQNILHVIVTKATLLIAGLVCVAKEVQMSGFKPGSNAAPCMAPLNFASFQYAHYLTNEKTITGISACKY